MTVIDWGIGKRYRHSSGALGTLTDHQRGKDGPNEYDFVVLYAIEDPRSFDGQPFKIVQDVEKVLIRRDPDGPYTLDNAEELEIPGRYRGEPLKVTRAQFDTEWTLVEQ